MNEKVKELTPKQVQGIRSLLTKHSISEAAKDAGVTDRTVYRWLEEPEFKKALTQAEDLAIDAAARGLVGMTEKALTTITEVLDSATVHPATRLRAAECVLANVLKLYELRNLAARVAALEAGR